MPREWLMAGRRGRGPGSVERPALSRASRYPAGARRALCCVIAYADEFPRCGSQEGSIGDDPAPWPPSSAPSLRSRASIANSVHQRGVHEGLEGFPAIGDKGMGQRGDRDGGRSLFFLYASPHLVFAARMRDDEYRQEPQQSLL